MRLRVGDSFQFMDPAGALPSRCYHPVLTRAFRLATFYALFFCTVHYEYSTAACLVSFRFCFVLFLLCAMICFAVRLGPHLSSTLLNGPQRYVFTSSRRGDSRLTFTSLSSFYFVRLGSARLPVARIARPRDPLRLQAHLQYD